MPQGMLGAAARMSARLSGSGVVRRAKINCLGRSNLTKKFQAHGTLAELRLPCRQLPVVIVLTEFVYSRSASHCSCRFLLFVVALYFLPTHSSPLFNQAAPSSALRQRRGFSYLEQARDCLSSNHEPLLARDKHTGNEAAHFPWSGQTALRHYSDVSNQPRCSGGRTRACHTRKEAGQVQQLAPWCRSELVRSHNPRAAPRSHQDYYGCK